MFLDVLLKCSNKYLEISFFFCVCFSIALHISGEKQSYISLKIVNTVENNKQSNNRF